MPEKLPDWTSSGLEQLRPFSAVRLVAFDVDGTLQSKTLSVYDTILAQNRKLHKNENKVETVIATGRTFFGLWSMLKQWKTSDHVPVIVYNGSVILRPGTFEIIKRCTISVPALKAVLLATKKYDAITLGYFISLPFEIDGSLEAKEWVVGWHGSQRYEKEFNGMVIEWSDKCSYNSSMPPTAILVDVSSINQSKNSLIEDLSLVHDISVTSSSGDYIEIRPFGSDKGVALSEVAEMLAVKKEAVLALGDGDNDVEMLQWAGIGVAVEGASNLAIEASDYVCNHRAAEGAVEVLRLVNEAKRYFSDN